MGVGSNLRKLGSFLEACERGDGTVRDVAFVEGIDPQTGPTTDVELTIPSPPGRRRGFTATDVDVDPDGRLLIALASTAPVVPATGGDLEVTPTDATVEGTVTITLDASVLEEAESADTDDTGVDAGERTWTPATTSDSPDDATVDARGRDRDVPPFRDPELLAEVYESCETFAEMGEAIGMDVTAETVRRYMIDHGIHEPRSYDADDADDESAAGPDPKPEGDRPSQVVLADGVGLPDGVTVEALVETVSRSNTIYEAKRELGLDRDDTLDLLRRLDLVDLVVGRVATEHERAIDREVIVDRLREASGT